MEKSEVQPSAAECGEIQGNDPPIPIPYPSPIPNPIPDPNNESGAGKPPTHTRFVPPKAKEVREYCQGNGLTFVDPERFVNFYQSKGWKVGKEPMKDWKAAVRGWNSRDKPEPKKYLLDYREGENWTL